MSRREGLVRRCFKVEGEGVLLEAKENGRGCLTIVDGEGVGIETFLPLANYPQTHIAYIEKVNVSLHQCRLE